MPRLKAPNGITVTVSAETAELLGSEYELLDGGRSETPDTTWKVAELKAHAEENGIDLLGASTKADILTALELAADSGENDEPAE